MQRRVIALSLAVMVMGPAAALAQPTLLSTVLRPPGGGNAGDGFGKSVAVGGGYIVVGAPGDDERGTDAGAVYVFYGGGPSAGRLLQKLVPADLRPGDRFGWSVAVHDYTPPVMPSSSQVRVVIVAGAPGDDRGVDGVARNTSRDRGASYVFFYGLVPIPPPPPAYVPFRQEARLQPPELEPGDEFGWTVGFFGLPMAPGSSPPGLAIAAIQRDVSANDGTPLPDAGLAWTFSSARDDDGSYSWTSTGTVSRPGDWQFWVSNQSNVQPVAHARFGFSIGASEIADLADDGRFFGQALTVSDPTNLTDGRVCGLATEPDGTLLVAQSVFAMASNSPMRFPGCQPPRSNYVGVVHIEVTRLAPDGTVLGSTTSTDLCYSQVGDAGDCVAAGSTGTWTAFNKAVLRPGDSAPVTGFADVRSIDADASGSALVIDGFAVRRIAADGGVSTIAGSVSESGTADGTGTAARFLDPRAIAVESGDVVLVGDGPVLRRVRMSTGETTTVAGAFGSDSQRDGVGTGARFLEITALDVDADGTVWIADAGTLRLMRSTGEVQTIAGTFGTPAGVRVDGTGALARLAPTGLTVGGEGAQLLDGALLRSASRVGAVRTWAGTDLTPDGLFGYSLLDTSSGQPTALVGAPLTRVPLTTIEAGGAAWEKAAPCTYPACFSTGAQARPIVPAAAASNTRYGTALAQLDNGVLALGPANGCLWKAPHECVDDAAGTPAERATVPVVLMKKVDDRWRDFFTIPPPALPPHSGYGSAMAAGGNMLVVGAPQWDDRPEQPGQGDTSGPGAVYVYDLSVLADDDLDTLPDAWETAFGLSPSSALGDDGAEGDPDRDGLTNAEEFAAQSHPRNDPAHTRYFAEGATSNLFSTLFALVNPGDADATVVVRFEKATGSTKSRILAVPARQRRSVVAHDDPYMADAEFSTVVESDVAVVVDRLMSWHAPQRPDELGLPAVYFDYGSHGERGIAAPETHRYLAEGATHSGFELFYLLHNPGDTDAEVLVRYLLPSGAPVEKTYRVAAHRRLTIWVNEEQVPEGSGQWVLADREMSADITSTNGVALLVERAMYRTTPGANLGERGRMFEAGHASAGITEPATRWFFAEGATGDFFDLFFLIANPSTRMARVRATYLLDTGVTFTKQYDVAPQSRVTVWADRETFDGVAGEPLRAVNVSTSFESVNAVPVVAERAMWWPGPTSATWTESHASAGAVAPATRWAVAAGTSQRRLPCAPDDWCLASTRQPQPEIATYYLIANPGDEPATVRLTLLFGGPASSEPYPSVYEFPVAPHSRQTVRVWTGEELLYGPGGLVPPPGTPFPPPGTVTVFAGSYGALFESLGERPVPIVVEWAIYNDALGIIWAAGANALATVVK